MARMGGWGWPVGRLAAEFVCLFVCVTLLKDVLYVPLSLRWSHSSQRAHDVSKSRGCLRGSECLLCPAGRWSNTSEVRRLVSGCFGNAAFPVGKGGGFRSLLAAAIEKTGWEKPRPQKKDQSNLSDLEAIDGYPAISHSTKTRETMLQSAPKAFWTEATTLAQCTNCSAGRDVLSVMGFGGLKLLCPCGLLWGYCFWSWLGLHKNDIKP